MVLRTPPPRAAARASQLQIVIHHILAVGATLINDGDPAHTLFIPVHWPRSSGRTVLLGLTIADAVAARAAVGDVASAGYYLAMTDRLPNGTVTPCWKNGVLGAMAGDPVHPYTTTFRAARRFSAAVHCASSSRG